MTTQDPFLDEGLRGYIHNTAKREYWRVKAQLDFEDLVQDGYLIYYKCRNRYVAGRTDLTGTKDERRWFQSLFKTAYANHIHTLAAKHKGVSETTVSQIAADANETSLLEKFLPAQDEQASFLTLLASAPAEIKQLVDLLINDQLDLLKPRRRRYKRRLLRETTNEFYCRILGVDPQEHNMVGKLKTYFGN